MKWGPDLGSALFLEKAVFVPLQGGLAVGETPTSLGPFLPTSRTLALFLECSSTASAICVIWVSNATVRVSSIGSTSASMHRGASRGVPRVKGLNCRTIPGNHYTICPFNHHVGLEPSIIQVSGLILFCWLFKIKDRCKKVRFQQTHYQYNYSPEIPIRKGPYEFSSNSF